VIHRTDTAQSLNASFARTMVRFKVKITRVTPYAICILSSKSVEEIHGEGTKLNKSEKTGNHIIILKSIVK